LVEVNLITSFADSSVVVLSPHQAAPVGIVLLGFYAGFSPLCLPPPNPYPPYLCLSPSASPARARTVLATQIRQWS